MSGGISTKKKVPLTKKEQFAVYKQDHAEEFKRLGVEEPYFAPKQFWNNYAAKKVTIGIFDNEFERGVDIYLEQVDQAASIVLDVNGVRTLFKLPYNKFYKTEYPINQKMLNDHGLTVYDVEIEELVDCSEIVSAVKNTTDVMEFDIPDPDADAPFEAMTLRDYASIHLCVPNSHKAWLNEIIKSKSK